MPKYAVTVTETVCVYYQRVEIEAADEREAELAAEEMRLQGELGEPVEELDDVNFYIVPVETDTSPA